MITKAQAEESAEQMEWAARELEADRVLLPDPLCIKRMRRAAAVLRAFGPMQDALDNLMGPNAETAIKKLPDGANGRIKVTAQCIREALTALKMAKEIR